MKVAYLLPRMDLGGVEQGTFDLAKGLIGKGHSVVIISEEGRFIPELKKIGVKHYPLKIGSKNPFLFPFLKKKLRDIIKKEKPDIIHCRSRVPAIFGYYVSKDFPNTHLITSFHGFYRHHTFSRIMGKGERVIVVSKALSEFARKVYNIPEEKIRLVYNGVGYTPDGLGDYRKKEGGCIRIGTLSRFTPLKGLEYLILALNVIPAPAYAGINLAGIYGVLAGRGKRNYLKKLKKIVYNLGLSERIEFLSPLSSSDFFNKIDIFVSPSVYPEGFGRTLVESQIAEVPVIATNLGASPEIVRDKETGLLIPPKDPKALSSAILWILNHKEESEKMVKRAREEALTKFSLEEMIEKTISVYEEVL